jgi:hypothetical protein
MGEKGTREEGEKKIIECKQACLDCRETLCKGEEGEKKAMNHVVFLLMTRIEQACWGVERQFTANSNRENRVQYKI